MSKQTINIGASPNDGTGTPLRTSFDYTNQNFTEIYTALGGGVALPGATTQVIFNDGGTNLAGDAGLVYNKTTDALTVAGLVTAGSATITGAATVGTTLGVTGVSTLTGNAFANGSATVAAGTPGAFANAALTINNRGGVSDLSLIALGYRPNGTVLNGAAYIGFITTSGSGNVLGDLIFGTRSVTTDTAPTERYRIDSTGISTWSVAGTTAMTLDSTGLGIGAVANAKLDVAGAATVVDSRGQLYIHTTDAAAIDVGAQLTLGGVYTGSNNYAFGGIAARKENGTTNVAGYLDFLTTTSAGALTSRMRIDSTGNVGIGVTPTTSRLLLKGDGTNIPVKIVGTTGDTTIPHLVIDKKDNNTTTSQLFIQFVVADNGAGSGQINANGVNQAAFGTYSDSRLKKNIVSLPSQLANILSLRPVEFDYKDGNGHQIGFIAQEMQEVYADAVGEQEGFLTVSGWNKTEARLVSAIKELAAKVQALEAKLA